MKKRTSLKDIALRVGVSTSLVSYVLNNQLEDRINKDTAERIRKAAAELNYQPNQIAKSLKINKTQTIGLIVADISNPYSSSIARIIEDEAKKSNYTVIFGSADESYTKAQDLIGVLLSRQVDGFIIAPPEGLERQLATLQQQDVPFVLIDRYFPSMEVDYITIDNFDISYKAVTHLIDNGFRNIGIVNYKTKLAHLKERTKGYKKALQDAEIAQVRGNIKEIFEKNLTQEVKKAIDGLLHGGTPIDAIFLSSSNVAIEGLAYLRELGIRIPDDLGVVCFDETKAYDLFQYPLTYIRQPLKEIGETAVKLLLDSMNGQATTREVHLHSELIIRGSSGRTGKNRAMSKRRKTGDRSIIRSAGR